jgi:hypothetical protein
MMNLYLSFMSHVKIISLHAELLEQENVLRSHIKKNKKKKKKNLLMNVSI